VNLIIIGVWVFNVGVHKL